MRENTERPITCEMGTNVLAGTERERIVREAYAVLDREEHRLKPVLPKWDGHAAERIVHVLLNQAVAEPAVALT
jgi:UDP-N-acetylglucosamine 2-epimerase (non-hydrolysing)